MPSWIVDAGAGVRYMYYIGWTVRNTVPYHNSIGLALTRDGADMEKYSPGPIFSPDVDEPFFTGTSCVLIEGGVWKNWYLSCVRWETIDGRPEPFYDLKYAESDDGIRWRRGGRVAVPLEDGEGGSFAHRSSASAAAIACGTRTESARTTELTRQQLSHWVR